MARHSLLEAELEAVTETGLYESRESFLSDAVQTLFAARPDLRETVACRLYEKGVFSLGRAAEWTGLSIEELKGLAAVALSHPLRKPPKRVRFPRVVVAGAAPRSADLARPSLGSGSTVTRSCS